MSAPFDYLLLWSGSMPDFQKTRIPAIRSYGLIGHWCNGELFIPDEDALEAALPRQYRAGFARRRGMLWFDAHSNNGPAVHYLKDTRGRDVTTLYLQPLSKEARANGEEFGD